MGEGKAEHLLCAHLGSVHACFACTGDALGWVGAEQVEKQTQGEGGQVLGCLQTVLGASWGAVLHQGSRRLRAVALNRLQVFRQDTQCLWIPVRNKRTCPANFCDGLEDSRSWRVRIAAPNATQAAVCTTLLTPHTVPPLLEEPEQPGMCVCPSPLPMTGPAENSGLRAQNTVMLLGVSRGTAIYQTAPSTSCEFLSLTHTAISRKTRSTVLADTCPLRALMKSLCVCCRVSPASPLPVGEGATTPEDV